LHAARTFWQKHKFCDETLMNNTSRAEAEVSGTSGVGRPGIEVVGKFEKVKGGSIFFAHAEPNSWSGPTVPATATARAETGSRNRQPKLKQIAI
jgi:hypothetical protein